MDSIIHQWLSTIGDSLLKMKQDLTAEQNEIKRMTEKSELVLYKIRDDFSHGNVSLEQRTYLIAEENPNRVKINELGIQHMERIKHMQSIESELNDAIEKRNTSDTDVWFDTLRKNIDHRMTNVSV